jgi:hypothetical protein
MTYLCSCNDTTGSQPASKTLEMFRLLLRSSEVETKHIDFTEFIVRDKVNPKCKKYIFHYYSELKCIKTHSESDFHGIDLHINFSYRARRTKKHTQQIHIVGQICVSHATSAPEPKRIHARTGVSVLNGCYETTTRPKRIHAHHDDDHHHHHQRRRRGRRRQGAGGSTSIQRGLTYRKFQKKKTPSTLTYIIYTIYPASLLM